MIFIIPLCFPETGIVNNIRCVLFDLDGVLVDACDWHYEALNHAMQEVLGFRISREDHLSKYNGLPTLTKLRMLEVDECSARRVEELKQEYTLRKIYTKASVMREKQELHSYLKDKGIKIACVTNSVRKTAVAMLRQTGQYEYMDLIVSNEDVERNKPYPDCYNYAVEKLMVDPRHALCVEDSEKGIQAARSSCVSNLWVVSDSSCVTLVGYKEIAE